MKLNEAEAGGSGYSAKMPAPPAPTPAGIGEELDGDTDEFGYPKEKAVEDKKEIPPPPKVEEEKVDQPATGYGKEIKDDEVPPPPAEDKSKEKTPVATTDEEKLKQEISEAVKALPETLDKEKIEKFAIDNKFTPEQLKAYAQLAKEDVENNQKAIIAQRKAWDKELRTDAEFGGENFDKSVFEAEKVLQKFLPNTKKVLTERGSMLPPYIMKDLLSLSKALNPKNPLILGDAGETKEEKHFLEEMY